MACGIVYFTPGLSKADRGIFLRRTLRRCKTVISCEGKPVSLFRLPVCETAPSEKAMRRFVTYLKDNQIDRILLSQIPPSVAETLAPLTQNFTVFDGFSVINYKIYDILRKYAAKSGINLAESTVVLCTDIPETARQLILKLYRHVRRIRIETGQPERFGDLAAYFLEEYGLYLPLTKQEKRQNEVYISADGQRQDCDIVMRGGSLEVSFFIKDAFRELSHYCKYNQATVEFLCYLHEQTLSDSAISRFFKIYAPKISKIKNND